MRIVPLAATACVMFTFSAQADWPQFRGPSGQGIARDSRIPLKWDKTNAAWSVDIPGIGWSSPVVQGDHVWLATAVETKPTPEQIEAQFQRSQLDRKKFQRRQVAGKVSLRVLALDRNSGEVQRNTELASIDGPEAIHVGNSYASPTPVIDGKRLYVHFGIYGTFCLDSETLDVLWKRSIPVFYSVGVGSSPIVHKDHLILVCDGVDKQFVIALDKDTGEIAWRKTRPPFRSNDGQHRKAYSTPLLISQDGQDQLVVPGAQWIVSYDPATGDEIWRVDHGAGFSTIPRPVYANGVVYTCTGFGQSELLAIKVDGVGDITKSHVLWKEKSQIPKNSSPLLVDDLLFMISDNGIATCLDAKSGSTRWRQRISGNYSASPIFANGHFFVFNMEGKVSAVKASVESSEPIESNLGEQLMASPAVLKDSVLMRTRHKLYCIKTVK